MKLLCISVLCLLAIILGCDTIVPRNRAEVNNRSILSELTTDELIEMSILYEKIPAIREDIDRSVKYGSLDYADYLEAKKMADAYITMNGTKFLFNARDNQSVSRESFSCPKCGHVFEVDYQGP